MSTVLQNKTFRLVWSGQLFYQIGSSFVEMSLIYTIGEMSRSGFAVAFLFFLLKFPVLFMGPLSGVLVDRCDRRKIMLWTAVIRLITAIMILVLYESIIVVFVFVLLYALLGNLYRTAEGALLPEVVDKDELMQASGLFNITEHGTTLLGLGLVFGLNAWFGHPELTFGLGAIFFVVGVIYQRIIARLPISVYQGPKSATSAGAADGVIKAHWIPRLKALSGSWRRVKNEFTEGFNYVKDSVWCRRMVIHLVITNMVVLIVISIAQVFGSEYLAITSMAEIGKFVILPVLFGFVMSVAALPYMQRRHSKLALIAYGGIVSAAAILSTGLFKLFYPWTSVVLWARWVCYFLMFLIGASAVYTLVPGYVLLQETAENRIRGRALGMLFSAITGISAIPLIISGLIVEKWGAVPVMVGLGFLLVLYSSTLVRYAREVTENVGKNAKVLAEP